LWYWSFLIVALSTYPAPLSPNFCHPNITCHHFFDTIY
jgi:hypothetical protein